MKKKWIIGLLLTMTLTACGSTQETADTQEQDSTPAAQETVQTEAAQTQAAESEEAQTSEPEQTQTETAAAADTQTATADETVQEAEADALDDATADMIISSFLDWTGMQYIDYENEVSSFTANQAIPIAAHIAYQFYDYGFEEYEEDIDVSEDTDDEEETETYRVIIPYSTLEQVMLDYFGTTYSLDEYIGDNDSIEVRDDSVIFTEVDWDTASGHPDYLFAGVDSDGNGQYIASVGYSVIDNATEEDSGVIYVGEYTFTYDASSEYGYVLTDMKMYAQ